MAKILNLELLQKMVLQRKSLSSIATAIGCTNQTVRNHRHKVGIFIDERSGETGIPIDYSEAERLLEDGQTCREASIATGIKWGTLRRWWADKRGLQNRKREVKADDICYLELEQAKEIMRSQSHPEMSSEDFTLWLKSDDGQRYFWSRVKTNYARQFHPLEC